MRNKTWILALIILLFTYSYSASDEIGAVGEIALNQAIKDIANDMTILCLAAHPDDEDGATLSYYRKRLGARTAVLYATRGEGGQNEIGSELYEELGVIRAFETQSAAKVYGTEVYSLNKRDFGYSKSAEETFGFWDYDDSLRRMVKIIREVRPDVIITNHDTMRGHGHHQAMGILALEAFDDANDPDKFSDQIEQGMKPWQVKRLFVRCGKDDADVAVNIGEYDQLYGLSYAQIANEGLKLHKSQGMGGNVKRGNIHNYYKLAKSSQPVNDKINGLLDGLIDGSALDESPIDAKDALYADHDRIAKDIIGYIHSHQGENITSGKKMELEEAVARSLDLYLSVDVGDKIVTRGQTFSVDVSLTNCGQNVIENLEFRLQAPEGWSIKEDDQVFAELGYNETATSTFNVAVSEDAKLALPYAKHLYDDSFAKPLLMGIAKYRAYDTELSVTGFGQVDIAEDMEIQIHPKTAVIPVSSTKQEKRFVVNVINRLQDVTDGRIELTMPAGWLIDGAGQDFHLEENGQAFEAFDVTIPPDTKAGNYSIDAEVSYNSKTTTASNEVSIINVKVADGLYVGYVKSYDDTMEWALGQLDVKAKALKPDDLRFGDLSVYDTIILDIRAYLVRDDLVSSNQRMLEYVRNGGNLVVMYNKTFEWNSDYAPYELVISRDRVTVEEAPITVLAKEHPLFNYPNKIDDADWEGWIQERGLYFPTEWSPQYEELLSCSDPDEKPLHGGYLIAKYGKGTYIYTSYVWYRQLQNLNHGAFRNFANMISLPKYNY